MMNKIKFVFIATRVIFFQMIKNGVKK